jgi:phosphopantetheine adenylyltransferase
MTDTLPIVVIDADPSILPTLSYSQVVEALQSCASANDNHTVNCQAFDDLSVFLRKNFGIKNITPTVAACFYEYFNENANRVIKPVVEKEEPVVYLPVNEPSITVVLPTTVNEVSKVKTDVSVVLPTTVVEPTKEKTLINEERAYPFEPFEPFEPLIGLLESDRDIKVEKVEKVPEPVVRHIEDSATTTTTSITESSSNDAIEAKLRALLEATETSEVSRTE